MDTRARAMTALLGVPLLIFAIARGRPWHFSLLVLAVTFAALREYYEIVFLESRLAKVVGFLAGASVALGIVFQGDMEASLFFVPVLVTVMACYVFLPGSLRAKFDHLSWTVLGTFYIGYFVPHFVLLYRLAWGKEWVFLILLVIMSGDSAGYFVGKAWGKHKLCPELSPNKTVEGAISITAVGILAGLVGGRYLLPEIAVGELLFLGFVLAALGQTGDLFESWIKRVFSVKDSGALLPGHGGILDRIDSLIFPTVFTTYYVRMLHS
jgi:phosphatidate cytidylyltransferase